MNIKSFFILLAASCPAPIANGAEPKQPNVLFIWLSVRFV
jgi:hypothetical protein